MELIKKYNETVKRLEVAEEWFKTAPTAKLEDGEKRLIKLLEENRKYLNKIIETGRIVTTEEVVKGFKI